ncbi:MAG: ATP-binding protein [Janthinobacterium lividum]
MSITARIALLSIALALVTSVVLLLFVSRQTHTEAIAAVRRETIEQANALSASYRSGGIVALRSAMVDADAANDPSLAVLLLEPNGRHAGGFGPSNLTIQPLGAVGFQVARIGHDGWWETREAGYTIRRIGGWWLLTARTLDLVIEEDRALERALLLSMLLAPALGIAAGLVVARYVGQRLDRIAAVVEHAGQGDLSRRVTLVAGGGDAFDRLAARLNAMLAKLEQVMGELRVVTDGLAHDLRSPLARLRTKTETALLTNDHAQREAALAGLLGETDLVLRMLSTLIEISRSEAATRDRFIQVDAALLVEELAELYAPVVEDAGLQFRVAIDGRPAPSAMHRELISQAITNLLDNAIHHGASGGEVTLRLVDGQGEGITIQVEDRGPGIASSDRAQARRRFGRLDSARSAPGAGLGLTLIEAVARLHGGSFDLGDNAPGLVARIILPG